MKRLIFTLMMTLVALVGFTQNQSTPLLPGTYVTRTIQANWDTLITTQIVTQSILKYVPPTTPTVPPGTIVGGITSKPITLQSGTPTNPKIYQNLTIDLGATAATAVTGNGIHDVILRNCKIINGTKVTSGKTVSYARGVEITNCTNVTIDGNFISDICSGVHLKACTGPYNITNNQFLNITNNVDNADGNIKLHAINIESCNGGGQHIRYNHVEEIASMAPYAHDQISVFKSNGKQGDSIDVAYNWVRGGQMKKDAAGDNGAAAFGVGDSGGSFQSFHHNVYVQALGIAVDFTGTSLHVWANKCYAKQPSTQPLSTPLVCFGNAGNNVVEYNTWNFTGPNGQNVNANFSMVKGTLKGQNTNKYDPILTASILPAVITTMK